MIYEILVKYGDLTTEEVIQALHNERSPRTGNRYKDLPNDKAVERFLSAHKEITKAGKRNRRVVWSVGSIPSLGDQIHELPLTTE